ncbi:MAG: lipopolysaccharide biosynthesis protein, partial [Elusimicrobia bacterium]|nr:lipopolysaccharide biosynthesis protein [Elusimicrobiota bacterium]
DQGADRLFGDRRIVSNLRSLVVRGGIAKVVSRVVQLGLRIAGVVVMARLVSPDDYGVFLMTTSFTLLLTMFNDMGLAKATVQRQEINHAQVSTLFWVNAAAGGLFFLFTLAAAPVLGWFYAEPRLVPVTMAMGTTFILSGLVVQHGALLQRQMRFMTLETIAFVAQVAGAVAMYWSAWLGAGYWALVLNIVVIRLVEAVLTWRLAGWRPGWPRRGTGVRGMLVFGGHLSGAGFVSYFNRNLDNILIGLYWGPAVLGIYSKAYGLLKQPLSQIGSPTSAVIVPALSRLQDEPVRFRDYFIKAMKAVVFLAMPMVVFTWVDARELVLILLGRKWLEVVPLFKALAPAAILGVSQVFATWLYQSLGRGERMFKSSTAVLGVLILAFVGGLPWGGLGVAAAYSAAYCLIVYPSMAYAVRGTPLTLPDIAGAVWRPIAFAAAAGAATAWFKTAVAVPGPVAARCGADLAFFGLAYAAAWAVLPGGREFVSSISGPFMKWGREYLDRKRRAKS